MNNLWKFIQQYNNFLSFILLEVVAFILIITFNAYPRSSAFSTCSRVVGGMQSMQADVTDYFSLKQVNEQLSIANAQLEDEIVRLRNLLEDSIENDSAYQYAHLNLHYIPAKVINITFDKPHNYITINKGARDGVKDGMGVTSADGVVGKVCTVGDVFSIVIPLIHTNLQISCRLSGSNHLCTTQWDGVNTHYINLNDVAAHVNVSAGDTVFTSGITGNFPEGIPVGIVEEADLGQGASYYGLRVKTMVDYHTIKYVQLIDNGWAQKQDSIEHEVG